MRHTRFFLVLLFALALPCSATHSRIVVVPSYEDLLSKADLVVIAEPTEARDLQEKTKILGAPAVGVYTTFRIQLVLKGNVKGDTFELHHYRFDRQQIRKDPFEKTAGYLINHATLAAFGRDREDGIQEQYLMFLKREHASTFVPLAGQTDLYLSVKQLSSPPVHSPLRTAAPPDATVYRFRLDITGEKPDEVSHALRSSVFSIPGVSGVQTSGSGCIFSFFAYVRGRDFKQDEKILEQILRVLGGRKEVRIVKSDLIHKRIDPALKVDASRQSTEPALPADADKPRR